MQNAITAAEARAIDKDAYVYGFPLVDSYRIHYSHLVDQQPHGEERGGRLVVV